MTLTAYNEPVVMMLVIVMLVSYETELLNRFYDKLWLKYD